jgi:hypothetical protein
MDFNNSPDFGDLPMPSANSQPGQDFPPPPNFDVSPSIPVTEPGVTPGDPSTEVGTTSASTASTAAMDKKQFIYTLLIALFITLVVGALVLFGVISYMKANEPPPTASKYTFTSGTTQPTTAPTAAAAGSTASPSATIVPTSAAEEWRIRLKQKNLKVNTLVDPTAATLSATLFGPIEKDEYVCTSAPRISDNQYFSFKKNEKVYERLCDSTMDKPPQTLSCEKYDTDLGIALQQTIFPKIDCSEGTIEAGTYQLYSKVFYNCDLAGKPLSDITGDACTDSIEVYSDEMTVEE